MKYRIITDGTVFKVECKGWFSWDRARYEDDWGHGERAWYDHVFYNQTEAEQFIADLRSKDNKPKRTWAVVKEFL
jgi:hypothetical protein